MDLRNDPRFFIWRRDWWQIALPLVWLAIGYAVIGRVLANT